MVVGSSHQDSKHFNWAFEEIIVDENPINNGVEPGNDTWKVYQIHPEPEDPDEFYTIFNNIKDQKIGHLDLKKDGRLDIVIAAFKQTVWVIPGPKKP